VTNSSVYLSVEEGEGHRDLCLALVDIYRFRVLERERRKRYLIYLLLHH